MSNLKKVFAFALPAICLLAYGVANNNVSAEGKAPPADEYDNDEFPKAVKYLFPPPVPEFSNPERNVEAERVAYGAVNPAEELEQPIAYSHKLHAGELKIECQYCHTYAKRSIHAGIPSTQICMNCHGDTNGSLLKVDPSGRPELYKLLAYNYGPEKTADMIAAKGTTSKEEVLDVLKKAKVKEEVVDGEIKETIGITEAQEIPWVKVHDLPDFVHFTHKRHVKAGLECQECHGEVQDDMTVGRRVSELTMGWCLNCHESHPKIQENYCEGEELTNGTCYEAELRRTEIKDCYTCHK
jgi:hypothetical protein